MSVYPGYPDPYGGSGGQQPYPDPYGGTGYQQPYPDPYTGGGNQQPYSEQPSPYGAPGAPTPYPGQFGYGPYGYGGMPSDPTEKNWMGITALVLGVLSLCCSLLTGVPAVIFGVLGIQEANQGRADNKALSIAGIALAVAFTILNFIATAVRAVVNGGAGY